MWAWIASLPRMCCIAAATCIRSAFTLFICIHTFSSCSGADLASFFFFQIAASNISVEKELAKANAICYVSQRREAVNKGDASVCVKRARWWSWLLLFIVPLNARMRWRSPRSRSSSVCGLFSSPIFLWGKNIRRIDHVNVLLRKRYVAVSVCGDWCCSISHEFL